MMLKRVILLGALLFSAPLAQGYVIDFQTTGFTIPADCAPPLPPQPLCVVVHAEGTANAIGGDVSGSWHYTANGQGLFGVGGGTWDFDDLGLGNNDLFGTFTIAITPPDAGGIILSNINYAVTGGRGIFAGLAGSGEAIARVNGAPPSNPLGAFMETGQLRVPEPSVPTTVPEPATLALFGIALGVAALARRRRNSV